MGIIPVLFVESKGQSLDYATLVFANRNLNKAYIAIDWENKTIDILSQYEV